MGRSAGTITLRFEAGTAGFVADVDKAKAKVREFGDTTKSTFSARYAIFALKDIAEGRTKFALAEVVNEVTRLRGALLGLGIGTIALAGIGIAAYEIKKHLEDISQMPQKISEAFATVNDSAREASDSISLTKAKLESELNKLDFGLPENGIKIALVEAQEQADKLAQSLQNDINKLEELSKKQGASFFDKLLGVGGSGPIQDELKRFQDQVFNVRNLQGPGIDRTLAAQRLYKQELGVISGMLGEASQTQARREAAIRAQKESAVAGTGAASGSGMFVTEKDQTANIAILKNVLSNLQSEYDRITGEMDTSLLRSDVAVAKQGDENKKKDQAETKRLNDELARAQEARLTGLAKINAEEKHELQNLKDIGQYNDANVAIVDKIYDAKRRAANVEQGKKDQGEKNRLNADLARAQEAQISGIAKIDAEEAQELAHLREIGEANKTNVALVHQIYDVRRQTEFNAAIEKYNQLVAENNDLWLKRSVEGHKAATTAFDADIKGGIDKLKEMDTQVRKLLDTYGKLTEEAAQMRLAHQVTMIGIEGRSGDPVQVLQRQQDLERQDIIERYNNSLKNATSQLERGNLQRQKALDLDRLDAELEERKAEMRQKGVKDFFEEMERQSQTAGNILYDAMHSALDGISSQLGKLFTGQKTSFGKTFQHVGEGMVQNTVKSGLQTGIGALAKHFHIGLPGKPDFTTANPGHVIVDNLPGEKNYTPVPASMKIPGIGTAGGVMSGVAGAASAIGGIGGLFKKLFGAGLTPSVSSSISFMANGGPMSPSDAYIVGDEGPELLTRTSGYITSNSELRRTFGSGGNSFGDINVDARGADVGVESRVYRAVQMAHDSAVATAVRANHERGLRTPKRS